MRNLLKLTIALVAVAVLYTGAKVYLSTVQGGLPLADADAFIQSMKIVVISAAAMTVSLGILTLLIFGRQRGG